jgi:hypothetical protein
MRNLVISVLVHALIAIVIYQQLKDRPGEAPAPEAYTITAIDKIEATTARPQPRRDSRAAGSRTGVSPRLLPRLGVDPMDSGTSADANLISSDGFEAAKNMDMEREDGVYPFLKYLHDKIENTLAYPEAMVRKGRTGIVTYQFELDSRGQLVGDLQVLHSEDPKLALAVRDQLKRVLAERVNPNIRLPVKGLRVVTTFDFRVFPHEELQNKKIPSLVKNILYFYPYAIRDRAIVRANGSTSEGYTAGVDVLKVKEVLTN